MKEAPRLVGRGGREVVGLTTGLLKQKYALIPHRPNGLVV